MIQAGDRVTGDLDVVIDRHRQARSARLGWTGRGRRRAVVLCFLLRLAIGRRLVGAAASRVTGGLTIGGFTIGGFGITRLARVGLAISGLVTAGRRRRIGAAVVVLLHRSGL